MKFNYEISTIFPTFVYMIEVSDIDNAAIKEYCQQVREQKEGTQISNRGGWHSKELIFPLSKELEELLKQMEVGANTEFVKQTGVANLKLGNFWININGQGDYNLAHDHQNSILSGVYYVDAKEGQGDLVLERNDHSEFFLKGYKNTSPLTTIAMSLQPRTGISYIFPSWIKHRVEKNEISQERISIAFNLVQNEI